MHSGARLTQPVLSRANFPVPPVLHYAGPADFFPLGELPKTDSTTYVTVEIPLFSAIMNTNRENTEEVAH